MAGILEGVDQRTNLVGENRLELLLFTLNGSQRFGINVFKVQEVIQCPQLTKMVQAESVVRGVANIRGKTISVIDLSKAIGKRPLPDEKECFIIVAEYNRMTQGFLVRAVDRIVNMNWESIKAPPKGLGKDSYMTAVAEIDNGLVEIIDVEKILAELLGTTTEISNPEEVSAIGENKIRILVVDDSSVARNQIKRTMSQMDMECTLAKNGRDALELLEALVADGSALSNHIDIIISDVEMPEMDGYTLTTEIRNNERLKNVPILLHTSLSGVFNVNMVEKVGADKFVPKFNADQLSSEVIVLLKEKKLIRSDLD